MKLDVTLTFDFPGVDSTEAEFLAERLREWLGGTDMSEDADAVYTSGTSYLEAVMFDDAGIFTNISLDSMSLDEEEE